MSSKRRRIQPPCISCSWKNCNASYSNEWELNEHIATHLETLTPHANNGFVCAWGTCSFLSKCLLTYKRHVYYHGYYNALLVQGKYVLDTNTDIPRCTAAKRTFDPIPLLEKDFYCKWTDCERTFLSIIEFQNHILQHAIFEYDIQKSPDDQRPRIKCCWDLCRTESKSKYRFIEHIVTHSNKKELACYHCGELFRTRTTLFDHLRRQPSNNTNKYQCAQCFKSFSTERLFHSHVVAHVNCYKCSMCDMTCSSLSALATHVRYRHLKDKPFQCVKCDYRCVRESDLHQHAKHAHSKEILRCEEPDCNYEVRTYQALRKHVLEVHKNMAFIYVCHYCNKSFKNGKSLSIHLIKKHECSLPSGHKRFTYRIDENGFYRLETTRLESQEVTEQILSPKLMDNSTPANEMTEGCYEIISLTSDQNSEHYKLNAVNDAAGQVAQIVISVPSSTR